MSTDGTLVYGSGFAYLGTTPGSYGNLEGVFAADPTTGAVTWIEDCHGDTYSVYPNRGKDHVYVVGHPHFCGNIGGYSESAWRSALAFSKAAVSTITPSKDPKYFDFGGQKAPRAAALLPRHEGRDGDDGEQAAWHVTGSGDYVVLAGEFLAVNGKAQQGLVRMAIERDLAGQGRARGHRHVPHPRGDVRGQSAPRRCRGRRTGTATTRP